LRKQYLLGCIGRSGIRFPYPLPVPAIRYPSPVTRHPSPVTRSLRVTLELFQEPVQHHPDIDYPS
jgi:hypothetical protein